MWFTYIQGRFVWPRLPGTPKEYIFTLFRNLFNGKVSTQNSAEQSFKLFYLLYKISCCEHKHIGCFLIWIAKKKKTKMKNNNQIFFSFSLCLFFLLIFSSFSLLNDRFAKVKSCELERLQEIIEMHLFNGIFSTKWCIWFVWKPSGGDFERND